MQKRPYLLVIFDEFKKIWNGVEERMAFPESNGYDATTLFHVANIAQKILWL